MLHHATNLAYLYCKFLKNFISLRIIFNGDKNLLTLILLLLFSLTDPVKWAICAMKIGVIEILMLDLTTKLAQDSFFKRSKLCVNNKKQLHLQ